jgi:hypothetical protein
MAADVRVVNAISTRSLFSLKQAKFRELRPPQPSRKRKILRF